MANPSPERTQASYVFMAIMFVAFFTAVIAYLFFIYIEALSEAQNGYARVLQSRINENELVINDALLTLDLLVQDNVSVQEKLQEERERRLEESVAAAQQIEKLQKDLEDSKVPNLSEIVSNWNPRVAKITCVFVDGDDIRKAEGSATLFPRTKDSSIGIASSRHIMEPDKNEEIDYCKIEFPTDSKTYSISADNIEFNADPDIDSALAKIPNPSPTLISLLTQGASLCATEPKIGDSIIILGYPSVGSKTTITATEGIISGIEEDYYVTSAKVEKGNSGGATILAGKNCYLGIPTFTAKGSVESLARILKQGLIF